MPIPVRKINLAVRLAQNTGTSQPNTFVGTPGSNTVNITDLRTVVNITNSGSPVGCNATVDVYGLSQSLTNQLSTLGMSLNIIRKNSITIEAGDSVAGMSTVFSGTVQQAYADYSGQPDVPFRFEAVLGLLESVAPAAPSSFTGSTSVVSVMQGLARQMGLGFKNNNVNTQLSSPYFSGSLWDQADRCAQHANIEWGVFASVLEIWPRGKSRETTNFATISPSTGMIGYPAFTPQGIIVSSVFRPELSFGSLVKVESSLLTGIKSVQPQANFPSKWAIYKLDLALSAQMPGGEWRSTCYCYNPSTSSGTNNVVIPPATK